MQKTKKIEFVKSSRFYQFGSINVNHGLISAIYIIYIYLFIIIVIIVKILFNTLYCFNSVDLVDIKTACYF